ncbi:MAG TPA: ABC transporter, partial [Lachnospiraceae bacterium]|nr:ABC transporter [Lachnospiraceae bacterium]
MILSCHHISKSFLEVPVLTDVTFHLEKGEKAAIVGINGAGKSTLLKIITGEMKSDEGTVSVSKDTALGYLAQNQNLSSDRTIYEELLDVRRDIVEMEDKIARDEVLMTQLQGDELSELLDEYNQLVTRFRDLDGYAYKGEITGILRGLGFTESEFGQSIQTLSGGQKTRAALAKLLLEKPDLMLLDEPTNHLDIRSIRWLETYLSNYKGTVLIVSHDRYF